MISFIITCHNNLEILKRCLTAFLWQNQRIDYEIILIDNNSDKENPDAAYLAFFQDLPIYLVKQPKLSHPYSLCKARNTGLRLAQFRWVVTLDSDIVINANYIDSLIKIIHSHSGLILTGERIFVNFNADTFPVRGKSDTLLNSLEKIKSASNYNLMLDRRLPGLQNISTYPHPWGLMHGGNLIFEKDKALEINGFDESYDGHWGYEDVDFAYRLITQAHCKPVFDENLFCYHLENANPERERQRFDKKNNPNWEKICGNILGFKKFKEKEYELLTQQIIL